MTTAVLTQPSLAASVMDFLRTTARLYAISTQYSRLFSLDETQLIARGKDFDILRDQFLKDVARV